MYHPKWTDRGAKDASTRARDVWQGILANPNGPTIDLDRQGALQDDIARRTAKGGAFPES